MNIYLDINGVILQKNGQPTQNVDKFLEYVINNHDVYWLTTHCKGDASTAVRYLQGKIPDELIPLTERIKPTYWQTLKTEAIDFTKDFLWYDDYIMEAEKKVLTYNNRLSSLKLVKPNKPLEFTT